MTFSKYINNDTMKNVLTRGSPDYCKWHTRVPWHHGWNHCPSELIN